MQLPKSCVQHLLASWPVARLATGTPGGPPHVVPVVFARVGEMLWSPVDGKPKRGGELARVRDLRVEPRAALLLDRYDADWTRLWWIRADVGAEVIRVPDPEHEPRLAGAVAALRAKYPQYARVPLFQGEPTLLRFAIERTVSWCAGEAVIDELGRL